jgi:hypothetical protein
MIDTVENKKVGDAFRRNLGDTAKNNGKNNNLRQWLKNRPGETQYGLGIQDLNIPPYQGEEKVSIFDKLLKV